MDEGQEEREAEEKDEEKEDAEVEEKEGVEGEEVAAEGEEEVGDQWIKMWEMWRHSMTFTFLSMYLSFFGG